MNTRRLWVIATAASICLSAGVVRADDEMGKGTIKGVCKLKGATPTAKNIPAKQDPYCDKANPKGVPSQALMVFPDSTLPYVFVYVKSGLKGKYKAPAEPIKIDQKNCMYSPHVQGMMIGQSMEIINSDATAHNIHAHSKMNGEFNFGQPKKGMKATRSGKDTFNKVEIMVQMKCDVHPWMSAFVGVVDNPFFATSGKGGAFEIKNLPDGEYEIEAWHEKWGKTTQKVTIKDGSTSDITIELSSEKAEAGPVGRTILVSTEGGEGSDKGCCGGKKVTECAGGKDKACCKAKESAAKDKVASTK